MQTQSYLTEPKETAAATAQATLDDDAKAWHTLDATKARLGPCNEDAPRPYSAAQAPRPCDAAAMARMHE